MNLKKELTRLKCWDNFKENVRLYSHQDIEYWIKEGSYDVDFAISSAFRWERSIEGFNYWHGVSRTIEKQKL